MTTIGTTNPYYASLYNILGKNSGDKSGTSAGGDYAAPRQTQSGAGITGSDTVFGSKLADALWTMESQGIEVDQSAGDTWLGETPSTAVEDEFMDLAKKTLAERIRDQYLESHDMTEQDLKAMSPEDREAVEAEIRKAILEAMGVNGQKQDLAMGMGGTPAPGDVQPTGQAGKQDGKDDPLLSM